jgi:hypothetical protein
VVLFCKVGSIAAVKRVPVSVLKPVPSVIEVPAAKRTGPGGWMMVLVAARVWQARTSPLSKVSLSRVTVSSQLAVAAIWRMLPMASTA